MEKSITESKEHAIFEYLLLVVGAIVLLVCVSYSACGDGAERLRALQTLAEKGDIVPTKFSIIGPLFSFPLYGLGGIIGQALPVAERYNYALLLIGLATFSWTFRSVLPGVTIRRFLLLVMIGSMFPNHIRFYYGETFTALAVGIGIAVVCVRSAAWGWVATVIGVANIPATIAGLGLVSFNKLWANRRLRYLLPVLAALLLICLDRLIRFGDCTISGYENNAGFKTLMPYSGLSGFSYPFFFGLLGICFSFGKGLIFFAPGLLLPVWRRWYSAGQEKLRECYTLWMWFIVGIIIIYAQWWAWYGGWTFGPRFFLFASIPASLAIAVFVTQPSDRLMVNLWVLLALALSVWVGICGAVFDAKTLEIAGSQYDYALEHLTWFVPEFSVLWRPFVVHEALNWRDWVVISYAGIVFVYLALPLVAAMGRQLAPHLQAAVRHALPLNRWRP